MPLDQLSEFGYGAVTMDAVAQRAGVHKTTVYRRWSDRESLLQDAVLRVTVTPFTMPDTGDIDRDVAAAAQARAEWLTGPYGRQLIAMIGAGGAQSTGVQLAIARILSERGEGIQERLTKAEDDGQLPHDVDADVFLKTLLAPLYFALLVTHEPLTPELVSLAARVSLTAARNRQLSHGS